MVFLVLLRKKVGIQKLIPHIRNSWEAPMDAVSIAAGVILLLFGQWLPLLPVDWRVAVFSIFWELRDIEHLYVHTPASQTLDYLLNHPHHVFICVFAPVSLLRDRLCLIIAVLATRPAPLFATAMRIELPTVFNVHQQLVLDLLGSENKQIQGLETPGMLSPFSITSSA